MIDRRQFSIVIIAFRLFLACYAAISTELVEEWGCYDSEFKLTCNDIDSHVGILEATFTPHCDGNQNCLFYDEDSIMKIISQSLSRRAETQEEEYAARKLLEALRNARLKEREREETEAKTSEFRSELPHTSTDLYDRSTINESAENVTGDFEILTSMRSDKKMMRDSLEKLISLYLTKLREDSVEYNIFEDSQQLHSRERRDLVMSRVVRRKKIETEKCKIMKRRIGTLDRIEIEKAIRNFTNMEFNIRKLLNYRCSGKNHCSFIFSSDHPYGIFWDEGIVHIKYICMDNFRVNKYCGELLQIGNEDWDLRRNINWSEIAKSNHAEDGEVDNDDGSGEGLFNGPRTAALQHNQNYYQNMNLRIIKADKNATSPVPQGKNVSEIKFPRQYEGGKDKSRNKTVYSQDFLKLKVYQNVEKPEPDVIEKLKKAEYVFHHKKDEEETIPSNGIESNEIDSVIVTTLKTPTTQQQQTAASSMIAPTIDILTTVIAQSNEINMTAIAEEDDENEVSISKEIKDFEKTVTTTMLANDTEDEYLMSNEVHSPSIFNSPERENYGVVESDISNEIEKSDEDYDENYDDPKKRKQNYTSRQHALPSSTLLHGFISNPGYPSYYIGNEKECRWRIKMTRGQKMSLTILDLHLRIEEYCKDSLEIIDTEYKTSIWRGCGELTRLVQVKSLSHHVEIVLRTKSRNIFPKRGFLIHYKAIGCVDPQLPETVKLVSRSENLLKLACEPEHVFPDTTHNEKSIVCINESWNETITKCVAINETLGRHIILVNEQYRAGKMSSDSDAINDILVPVCIIAGLFILNAIVFVVILRYRKQRHEECLDRELADL